MRGYWPRGWRAFSHADALTRLPEPATSIYEDGAANPRRGLLRQGPPMHIVIPDDYQDVVDRLECFELIRHHDVTRYREPASGLDELVSRLQDADIVVSIRE